MCFCTPSEDGTDFVILPCKHVYCNQCYQAWLTGDTHRDFPIVCLADRCERKLRMDDLAATLAPKEMTKLLRAALDHHVKTNSERFQWCDAPDCGGIIKRNEETSSGACSTCSSSYCFSCNAVHPNMSCKDYRLAVLPPDQIRNKLS